jgi:predicted phosphodiesterase
MELQLKIRLLLLTAISLMIASCEKDTIFPQEEHSVNQRFRQSMDWNELHPYQEIVTSSDDYAILFMGDSHIGSTKNLNNFFNIAKNTKASAVVMAGDLTAGEEKNYDALEKCIPPRDSLLSFLTVGNHDLWSNNGWNEFFTRFGPSCYLFTVESPEATDLFISLDTGSGTLGAEQLAWFEDVLKNQRPDYRRCIVFTHNNFFRFRHTETDNPPVEELNKLIELFTRHHVDMLVAGHDHKRDAVLFGITTYVVMEPCKDGADNAGYLALRVNNGDVKYSFENFD